MSILTPYNHPNYHDLPPQFPPDYASAWGEDMQGLWFDLRIEQVVQRFRWIPRGDFTMGSPKSELERESRELLHEVTLSQGYWLADTACTQELWQLIMNNNPSDFKADQQNPVDTVSWIDSQEFLAKLNQQLPELKAHLPTEAQWEYACRAGTTTPFSFGESISPKLVNYDGNYPYGKGEKGEYREKTIPVKALAANQWGLYQMHGNVWEWCFDEFKNDLGEASVTDPVIAQYAAGVKPDNAGGNSSINTEKSDNKVPKRHQYDSALLANADDVVGRVLRGGSWSIYGRLCRSAFRYWYDASDRFRFIGLRIALGH